MAANYCDNTALRRFALCGMIDAVRVFRLCSKSTEASLESSDSPEASSQLLSAVPAKTCWESLTQVSKNSWGCQRRGLPFLAGWLPYYIYNPEGLKTEKTRSALSEVHGLERENRNFDARLGFQARGEEAPVTTTGSGFPNSRGSKTYGSTGNTRKRSYSRISLRAPVLRLARLTNVLKSLAQDLP